MSLAAEQTSTLSKLALANAPVAMTFVSTQLGLTRHRLAQVVVPVGEFEEIWRDDAQVPEIQPLCAEAADERPRTIVAQHSSDLSLEHPRMFQLAFLGERQSLVVGDAAPQEERQPRSERDIAEGYGPADDGGSISLLIQEVEFDEQPLERSPDSPSKSRPSRRAVHETTPDARDLASWQRRDRVRFRATPQTSCAQLLG